MNAPVLIGTGFLAVLLVLAATVTAGLDHRKRT